MTDYSKLPREEARRRVQRSWVEAHAVAEVLSVRSSDARSWLKHFRQAGVSIQRLMEGEASAVAEARKVIADMGEPIKETGQSPIQRSAAKAKRALAKGDEEAATMRQKVQIMLWALGKCGTANLAIEALHRALVAAGESAHAMTDHVLECNSCFEIVLDESRRRYSVYLDSTKEADTYAKDTVFVEAPTAVRSEDWPAYRDKLGREQPKRVVHLVGYGAHLATKGLTTEEFETILDDYPNDVDASLILEGWTSMHGDDNAA